MLDGHKKTVLLIAVAIGLLLGGILVWKGGITLGTAPQLTPSLFIIGALVLLVTAGLVGLLFGSSRTAERASDTARTAGTLVLDNWEKQILLALVVLGVLVVGGNFVWIGLGITLTNAGPELTLPLIVIVGVVVLLVTLALVAVTFSVLNLSDKAQALALPEGSVRAVIALMLLLVFSIAAIFLYSNVASSGKIRIVEKLTTADVIELRKHATVIFTLPPFVEPPAAAPAGQTYTAYYRDPGSAAGDDIAKQLIVLLGTLVTAVASFYFGSSSVSSAQAAAERARTGAGGPNATNVSPPALRADGSSQPLAITGANLVNVNAVNLVSVDGKTSISADAASVKASPTSVTCTVTVPSDAPPGPYDVVVSDNANNNSTVPKGVSVDAVVAAPVAPEAATVDDVSPNPTPPDGTLKQFTITGSNLGKTSKVTLELTGELAIAASKIVSRADDKVVCEVTIPSATKPGKWDVVVSDGTTETRLSEGLQIG